MRTGLIAAGVALALLAVVVLTLFLPHPEADRGGPAVQGLPWQIESLPDGRSRVFGLTLGSSTLDEARTKLGADMQVAIVAAPGETGALEAFIEDAVLGAVTGKLILTADADVATLQAMRERAGKSEYMESTTRKYSLHADDLERAYRAPIRAIAFIPSVNLDEQIVLQRFGPPAERIRVSEQTEHFLYPGKGLDLVLDAKGKELLQYVAPRNFAALREPLVAKAAQPAGAGS